MKIGIVTYHRSYNYGALLQAIATRYVLEKEGNEVYYVDYWPDYHQQMYAFFSYKRLCSRGVVSGIKYLKRFLRSYKVRKRKTRMSELFIGQYINPYTKPDTETYDVIVYGSDQIWRKQSALKDYNSVYFGKNEFHAQKHIAFSASMGILPDNSSDRDRIKKWIKTFDAISVRENDLQHMLQQQGFSEVDHTLDPTLLMNASDLDDVLHIETKEDKENYALYYKLQDNSFQISQVRDFATRYGLKLKIITGTGLHDENGKLTNVTDPHDFVNLIKHASVVFSSSFHGLAFSIIYGRPVYASFAKNQGRAKSLLNVLGMNNCLLPPLGQIPMQYPSINYDVVYTKLGKMQNDTMSFLKKKI